MANVASVELRSDSSVTWVDVAQLHCVTASAAHKRLHVIMVRATMAKASEKTVKLPDHIEDIDITPIFATIGAVFRGLVGAIAGATASIVSVSRSQPKGAD